VTFSALYEVYSLLPSISRIGEQAHGSLRDSLRSRVSLKSTGARTSHMMDDVYEYREARRRILRGRKAKVIKHDRTKDMQALIGLQLLESGLEYKASAFAFASDQMVIRNINSIGSMSDDKKVAATKKRITAEIV
jgi:hypothetical protein